jgi:hypothetical protein
MLQNILYADDHKLTQMLTEMKEHTVTELKSLKELSKAQQLQQAS